MMLVIRDAQLSVFERASQAGFEARTLQHLSERYPRQFASLGDAGAREFVRKTVAAAQSNRIYSEGALVMFIDLVIEFGEEFERAPDRAWARKILAHPKLPDYSRMDAIWEKFASRTDGRILVRHDEKT